MKYGIVINGALVCDPIADHEQLASIAQRHGFAVTPPFTQPVDQQIAGRHLLILPGIEERPAPPAACYRGQLSEWKLDTDKQQLVRTVLYSAMAFDEAMVEAMASVNDQQDAALARITAGYTAQEVKTWPQQQAEAARWHADNSAAVPLLEQLAQRRGISVAAVVDKIQAKVQQAATLTGTVLGDAQAAADTLALLQARQQSGSLPDDWFDQLQTLLSGWRNDWPAALTETDSD